MTAIHSIQLPVPGIDELQAEARAEGYDFLDRLLDDWQSGENRFDGPGEIFVGAFDKDVLVGVGGLNRDPFLDDPTVGRIRRVYIRAGWRNQGLGRALVTALVEHARQNFRSVRLRAENPPAGRLYERMGFLPIDDPSATHSLTLSPVTLKRDHTSSNSIAAGTDTL